MKKLKRYVVARHDYGHMWGSHVYLADLETGEIAETIVKITSFGSNVTIETLAQEPILERISFEIEGQYWPNDLVKYVYILDSKLLSFEL